MALAVVIMEAAAKMAKRDEGVHAMEVGDDVTRQEEEKHNKKLERKNLEFRFFAYTEW